jgi:hypothetical protein
LTLKALNLSLTILQILLWRLPIVFASSIVLGILIVLRGRLLLSSVCVALPLSFGGMTQQGPAEIQLVSCVVQPCLASLHGLTWDGVAYCCCYLAWRVEISFLNWRSNDRVWILYFTLIGHLMAMESWTTLSCWSNTN